MIYFTNTIIYYDIRMYTTIIGCSTVLGLDIWQTTFDPSIRNLVIVILLCIASGLIFIAYLIDDNNENKEGWLIAGYITIFIACLLYIILFIVRRGGGKVLNIVIGILIIVGGLLVIIGYWPGIIYKYFDTFIFI